MNIYKNIFKEVFPSKNYAHLLEIDDIDIAIGKARFLILLFKSTCSSILAHMTEK